ncbi:MAG: EAL domain-containing protein [Thiotrichales bacterium]|nr:EAL domain-containing protein [Thiotrichales bacterium]
MQPIASQTFFKYFLRYFLPASLLVLVLSYIGMEQAQNQQFNVLKQQTQEKIISAKSLSIQNLDLVVRDVQYITQSELLNAVLNPSANASEIERSASLDALARDWQALMKTSTVYDQLRWLDESGQERLRVNLAQPMPVRSPEEDLQNKRNRYYFFKSMLLDKEQFYFSPFDLNIERDQIEEPRKPMIRVAKPVFDAQGNKRGVIVLNYLGSEMLSRIEALKSSPTDNLWLMNADGYWLLGSKAQDEWGFMYARPDLTLKHRYPEAWLRMVDQETGHFLDSSSRLWHFSTVRPMKTTVDLHLANMKQIVVSPTSVDGKAVQNAEGFNEYYWKVVHLTPKDEVVAVLRAARTPYYIALILGWVLIAVASVFLARARMDKELALKELQASNQVLEKTTQQLAADVEAKELAQSALEESVERYSSVLSASMDGFVLMNHYGVILECNQALYDILHLENKEIEGSFLGALFEGEQRQKVADKLGDLFIQGYCKIEVECIRDDKKFYTEMSLMPIAVTEQICAFMRDITEEKENDFQLEMAASVFTHANEGIILTDANFLVVDVNDEFEFITGHLREDVVGKEPSLLESTKQPKAFYDDMKRYVLMKGHWYGELWSRRKTGELFLVFLSLTRVKHPHDNSSHFVWMFTDITLEKQYQKRLQNSAHYDQLTSLPNRFLLNDRIQQAIMEAKRNAHFIAIVFIDLDGFKAINDTFGHDIGDRLLVNVSKQMKAALRATDTVARIGGDEFVAVIGALHNKEEAVPVFEKLLKAVSVPMQKADQTIAVSGSLGVTFFPQEEDYDGEQLIRQADQAMYQAKQEGKNAFHIFDIQQDSDKRDLIRNLNCIEQAILNDEFVLHYQPKVSLFSDEVVGLEALIRWQHPEKGLLYPGEFLPCVENTQMAIKLTECVVKAAMHQMETWQKQGIKLSVSVNVGAYELQKANFIDWIGGLLDQYPSVSRSLFELEVLETSALEDVRSIQELIQNCKNRGIGFALDDFGTGFASLSYLKRLPIETIKIDQSFIQNMFEDPEDITLLEGLIGLTKSLHRMVIAEGVETEEQGKMLIDLGCHYAQGYFIAKPMPAENIPAFLKQWKRPDAWVNEAALMDKGKKPLKT